MKSELIQQYKKKFDENGYEWRINPIIEFTQETKDLNEDLFYFEGL